MRLFASAALFLALLTISSAFPDNRSRSKRSIDFNDVLKLPAYRMPRDLRPVSYELEIRPSIKDATFRGRVKIVGVWPTAGSRIKLDAHQDLDIKDVKVECLVANSSDSWEVAELAGKEANPSKSEYKIDLQEFFKEGRKCKLDIDYTGNITSNESAGIFMHSYLDTQAQAHTFIATHLRLNNARRLFPCIDEPEYKAKFRVIIVRPRAMVARSNTPLEKSTEEPGDTHIRDVFEETPEMSTYQLAFMISDFESISPTRSVNRIEGRSPLEIKVWGRKDYLGTLSKVPNKIVTIINYLQHYFNISIGISKLDLVAMPMYMATKASDNWGLMFFK